MIDGRGSRGHVGAGRLLCAVPAVLASAALVTIVLGGLGRWTLPAVAGWVVAGWLLLVPAAERAAVRIIHRLRAPAGVDAECLAVLRPGPSTGARQTRTASTGTSATTRSRPRAPPAAARSWSPRASCG